MNRARYTGGSVVKENEGIIQRLPRDFHRQIDVIQPVGEWKILANARYAGFGWPSKSMMLVLEAVGQASWPIQIRKPEQVGKRFLEFSAASLRIWD